MGTKNDQDAKGFETVFDSIIQGLVVVIGACLLPVVVAVWKKFLPGEPPEWLQGTVANAVSAVVLVPAAWFATKLFSRAATRRRRATARAKGDRLSIYVARLGITQQ